MLELKKYDIILLLANIFEGLGIEVYLVGGAVRDMLLGRKPVDFDFVTELNEDNHRKHSVRISKLLGCTYEYNDHYHTAKFFYKGIDIDFIMARDETYDRVAARPRVWSAGLSKDLKRRDFTINSMAVSLKGLGGEGIIDPFNGREDLQRGVIKILHNRSFYDDPTRIFRGIKYASRFDFGFERSTRRLIKEALDFGVLHSLSPQRIKQELYGIFKDENLEGALKLLDYFGIMGYLAGSKVKINTNINEYFIKKNNFKNLFPALLYQNNSSVIKKLGKRLELGKNFEEICVKLRELERKFVFDREDIFHHLFSSQRYLSDDLLLTVFSENEEINSFIKYRDKVKLSPSEIIEIKASSGDINLEKARRIIKLIGSEE